MKRSLLWMLVLLLLTVTVTAAGPKSVILLIGDGMGSGALTLYRLAAEKEGVPVQMERMRYGGTVWTRAANSVVTDSAASGTALATGWKTDNGMISVLPDGTEVLTILEAAKKLRKSTGLVTTTTITHATPAVFAAHVLSRGSEADIAVQLMDHRVDVLMGGGKAYFIPKSVEGSKRTDDLDLMDRAKGMGYRIAETAEDLKKPFYGMVLGLFQMEALTTAPPEPSLAEMTDAAIRALSRDLEGFFLMVEGGQIDWKAHANDAEGIIRQTRDFDAAVGKAMDFARRKKDTLVIVTADHETGGTAVTYPAEGSAEPWSTVFTGKDHSGNAVAVLADGPGADKMGGLMDNTDIPKRIAKLWKIKKFPAKQ